MSQFGAEKFTTRSREVVEAAQLAATTGGNTTTEPIHLLVALLKQEDGATRSLVQKAGVDPAALLAQAEGVQQQLPRATGSTVQQPSASASLTRVLAQALDLAGVDEGRLRRHRPPPRRHRDRRVAARRRC